MIITIEETDIKYSDIKNPNFEDKKMKKKKFKSGIADDSNKSVAERAYLYFSQSAMYYQINSQFDKAAKVMIRAGGTFVLVFVFVFVFVLVLVFALVFVHVRACSCTCVCICIIIIVHREIHAILPITRHTHDTRSHTYDTHTYEYTPIYIYAHTYRNSWRYRCQKRL
jgi:hypothetical protein